eukprot:Phypoly_transcript_15086.p1 GENE.Phypoly_transcript_15086~~Phypoly_transcript_15086.p1  ORF type:complete len:227 (+),score=29.02 Phypoly_transcript_15086:261-941(+)
MHNNSEEEFSYGKGPIINAKVVILGSTGVGKTALSVRYCEGVFLATTKATIGGSFLAKNVVMDGVRLKLQLWDTAGQERFRSLAPMYYRGAAAAVLVYDITNPDSFQKTQDWVAELQSNVTDDIVLVVVGNKLDLAKQRNITKEKGKEFADTINASYIETSAKDGEGITQLFTDICKKIVFQRRQYLQYMPTSSANSQDTNYVIEYESPQNVRKKKQDDDVRLCCE